MAAVSKTVPPALAADDNPGPAALLARARDLVPILRERAARTVADRSVPPETIADFQRAGFFRVLQPHRYGGLQCDFSVFANLVRELAHGCASSAWVYAVVGELAWVMAMFPEKAQDEVWRDPAAHDPEKRSPGFGLGCAAVDPAGRAEPVEGGYRLTGAWRFVSGSDHAHWVMVTAPASGGDVLQFLVRRHELKTVDDWHVLGLIGTGSRTLQADNIYVPAHRTITQQAMLDGTAPGRDLHRDYPTCRAPRRFLATFSISPVLVGLAERALALVIDATRKKAAGGSLADADQLQMLIGQAAAEVETARMIFDTGVARAVTRLAAGETITERDVEKNRMMSGYMVRLAREAIDRLCLATGSGWIFEGHPLHMIFRDAAAGATHRAMSFETHAKTYARGMLAK